jgi:hypothetical protein
MQNTALASSSPWIISKQQDLIWFLGSALLGYMLYALAFPAGGLPAIVFFQVSFAIDGPHVYSTATRVLFDRDERKRQRLLFLALVPLCLIGPALLWLGVRYETFFLLVMVWGQFHISKQHMGFVMIYKRKARERADFKLDRYFTLVSLLLPFAYYLSAVITSRRLLPLFLIPALLFVVYYAAHQLRVTANIPKLLLLVSVIPLQWLAWAFAAQDPDSFKRLLAAAAITTTGHGVQYLRLMWLHNSNRYSTQGGLLGIISRNWIFFMLAALVLSLPQYVPGTTQGGQRIGCAIIGFLMLHYLLDSKIWRVRNDPELAKALRLV